ncbi:MAG: hypothetical protein HW403_889, partial [Dehalococcoidia bacterium]|nr:hypothetical protein [Dehalococcoidia bacterium]
TAGAYLNDAQNQRGQADLLRVVSFVLGGVAAVFGYFSLLQLQLGPDAEVVTRIYQYAARTGILVLLVSFAVYAGRESSKHRSRENESKRLANQLSTFRPFLAELDSASRDDLVKGASERYFPGYDGSYAGENLIEAAKKVKSDGASKEIVELLTNLLKVFQK